MITNLVPHGPLLIADMDTGYGGEPFKLCLKKKARSGTLNANKPQKWPPGPIMVAISVQQHMSLDSKFRIKFKPNGATISKATRLKQSCRFGNIPLPDLGRRSSQRLRSVLIVLIARTNANQQYDYDECIRTSLRSEGNRCRRHSCCWWIFSFLPGGV